MKARKTAFVLSKNEFNDTFSPKTKKQQFSLFAYTP